MVSLREKPFLFLIAVLAISEIFLLVWLNGIDSTSVTAYHERIVVGALSITILIAVLVISCVIFWIKIYSEIEKNKMKHNLGNHGIGKTSERDEIESKWPEDQLYYDTDDQTWYYISKNNEFKKAKWKKIILPEKK